MSNPIDSSATALYEGLFKGLWNSSAPAPAPLAPQPPLTSSWPPMLNPAPSPMDALAALAAAQGGGNDWLPALLAANKQHAAQQAAVAAVVQAAAAAQQQVPAPHAGSQMHAVAQALQAQAAQAAAMQAGFGGGWQGGVSMAPASNSNLFWPGLWPSNPQVPAPYPPAAPQMPNGYLTALDAQRMLAQVLYPDAAAAGASPAAAANALLAASQQQQQQQQPMGGAANPWMAAAAAAAAAGGPAAPTTSWPGAPPPGITPGWPPPEGMPGQQQHAFSGWQGAGSLVTAQAAAMMAAASGQAVDPSLQGQMAGLPPHMLGVGSSSAFRSVAGGNGNISGLSNGSGGSTATALLPQAKHAQSYDSAQ